MGSEEHLNVQFNPAALLSLGDARTFLEALSDVEPRSPVVPRGAFRTLLIHRMTGTRYFRYHISSCQATGQSCGAFQHTGVCA